MDLLRATTELYGDCTQELGSPDVYINGVLPTKTQMDAILIKAKGIDEVSRIQAIKQAAGVLILSRYPIANGKQANMQAAMTELVDIKLTTTLTTVEQEIYDAIKAAWEWVEAVRKTSNDAEADGTALVDIVWPV